MKRTKSCTWIVVTLWAFTGTVFVEAQNYTCTNETPKQKCLTINPQKFWIVGEIRTFAFGGDAKSLIVSELHQNGWLECEGQSLDVTDFPELRSAIGMTWGSRDPKQSFLVPDFRGIFLRGWNHAGSQKNPDGSDRAPQFPDPGENRVPPRTMADVGQGGKQGNAGDGVGSMQPGAVGSHTHNLEPYHAHFVKADPGGNNPVPEKIDPAPRIDTSGPQQSTGNGSETRPNNAYVMYFIYVGPYDLRKLDPKTGKIQP